MCEVPVFYATTDGQTRRIAEHMAMTLRHMGVESTAVDVASPEANTVSWQGVRAVMLGASLRAGAHQRHAEAFARRHVIELNARPSVFFSVSLSVCSSIPKDVDAAKQLAHAFPDRIGWRPTRVVCFGGRLAYSQYGWLTRLMMRRIARKAGGPIDTSQDHELTNWHDVRVVACEVAGMVRRDALRTAMA